MDYPVHHIRNFWFQVLAHLDKGENLSLLCVVHSEGSSPGRQGFKMLVSESGKLEGSIGGGIMEQKWVEYSKKLMSDGPYQPYIRRQVHKAGLGAERSGMICSGEQVIASYYLSQKDRSLVQTIVEAVSHTSPPFLILDFKSMRIEEGPTHRQDMFEWPDPEKWQYREKLGWKEKVCILGGGHVGLALSQIMNQLGFYVMLMDDRPDLNTMNSNEYAHEKHTISYEQCAQYIEDDPSLFIVVMTFGYKWDEICIRQLIDKKWRYLGVMGSQAKMKELMDKLSGDGLNQEKLNRIHTPVGIRIQSKTPMEIAVSIAAQIIMVKNSIDD